MRGPDALPGRALTIRQPYASLLVMGHKLAETRSWATPHRGPVAIHAGAAVPAELRVGAVREYGPFTVERDRSGLLLRGNALAWPYRLPTGCFIGAGYLAGVEPIHTATIDATEPDELALGVYALGRFAWTFTGLHPLKPTPARGRLGLWRTHPMEAPA